MKGFPTPEELENLFQEGKMERIGMGSRRACYRIPGWDGLCLKCYRSEAEISEGKDPGKEKSRPLVPSVVREIRSSRFDEKRNTCCQEYRYWRSLQRRLPKELMSVFPSAIELFRIRDRGWCLVEENIANGDGSAIEKFLSAWKKAGCESRKELAGALRELEDMLVAQSVRFFDPQTVMVQLTDGVIRLRIPDFEPATRVLFPVEKLFPALVRMKIRRRFARYRRVWGIG